MTAEQWLPLQEVPPASLAEYLQDRRRAGYTIVAVEQASDSVSLHQFTFPRQCVLLLGRLADWTETCHMSISQGTRRGSCGSPELGGHLCRGAVETIHERQLYRPLLQIPQTGQVRSLNVHVTGALVIWEYVRQHSHPT